MATFLQWFPPALSFVLFIAVGLDQKPDDFARLRSAPLLIITGLVAPLLLLPPLAIALAAVPGVPHDARLGLMLIALSPVGGFSTIYSYLAKASPALSVTLTTLSGMAAPVTIPLVSGFVTAALGDRLGVAAPIRTIAIYGLGAIVAPIVVGMWLRRRRPALADEYRPLLTRLALAGVILLTLLVVASDPPAFVRAARDGGGIVMAFIVVSFVSGWLIGAVIAPTARDRFTIAAEFTARNAGVSMAISLTVFGSIDLARFSILYIVLETPVLLPAALWFRRIGSTIAK